MESQKHILSTLAPVPAVVDTSQLAGAIDAIVKTTSDVSVSGEISTILRPLPTPPDLSNLALIFGMIGELTARQHEIS